MKLIVKPPQRMRSSTSPGRLQRRDLQHDAAARDQIRFHPPMRLRGLGKTEACADLRSEHALRRKSRNGSERGAAIVDARRGDPNTEFLGAILERSSDQANHVAAGLEDT